MGYETELTELIGPSGKSFRVYEDTSGNIRVKVNGTYVTSGNEVVTATTDAVTEITVGGSGALMGTLVSGEWFPVGSVFRLLMTGTGIVTLDSKDALGTITTGVFSEPLSGATNQIGFPYVGDSAV